MYQFLKKSIKTSKNGHSSDSDFSKSPKSPDIQVMVTLDGHRVLHKHIDIYIQEVMVSLGRSCWPSGGPGCTGVCYADGGHLGVATWHCGCQPQLSLPVHIGQPSLQTPLLTNYHCSPKWSKISPKLKCHQNSNVTKTEMTPKLKCHQN